MTYHMLVFDDTGCLDANLFHRQEAARYEVWASSRINVLGPGVASEEHVVDATSRFRAHGGSWVPSKRLEHALHDAALGRLKVPRV
jgi:hypothetical protein